MAKTITRKVRKPLSPKPAAKQADTTYPVEQEDLDEQQERLRKAAAAGADALNRPAPSPAEQLSAPATVPAKPLAPLAALWPSSVPARGEATPSQGPAPQKSPVAASAPKPAPAPPTPLTQPPAQSPPLKFPGQAPVAAPATKPPAPRTVNVSFALLEPAAKQVSLAGDFNGWASDAGPLKRQDGGRWVTTLALAPGRYQYKFVVDGKWIPDPLAHEQVSNQHGTLNSVVEVRI